MRWLRSLGFLLWASVALLTPVSGRAEDAKKKWDGLGDLHTLADSLETPLWSPPSIDLSQVAPGDALLIINPQRNLPVQALTTFLREGGRIALLDDGGAGDRLLSAYQVSRAPLPPNAAAPSLRGDPALRIAYPASEHPLVVGVPVLLTNHASELRHPELKPVFTFGRTSRALLLAGAVGAGRLVACGDGSLLINQHMTAPSHRRFAINLLSYLSRPGGKIWLIGPESRVEGTYGGAPLPLSRLDGWLKRLSRPDFPPAVLLLLSLALAGIALAVAGGALPRRSPYVRPDLFPEAQTYAGFAGRIAAVEEAGLSLSWPLLDYRRELEAELAHRLALTAPLQRAEAVRKARAAGLSAAQAQELDTLLATLDELALTAHEDDPPRQIQVSEFRNMIRKGEELLRSLGNDTT